MHLLECESSLAIKWFKDNKIQAIILDEKKNNLIQGITKIDKKSCKGQIVNKTPRCSN